MNKLVDLRDEMLQVLSAAQKERSKRLNMVEIVNAWGHKENVCAWAVYEMNTMLTEVNKRRSSRRLSPISLNDIQKVESSACGHSDYSSKFALYCAELTIREAKDIQP